MQRVNRFSYILLPAISSRVYDEPFRVDTRQAIKSQLECYMNSKADLCHLSRLETRFHQSIFKSLAPEMSANILKIVKR